MLPSDAPTRIAIRRPSPVFRRRRGGGHRPAQKRAHELRVPLKAAGGQDDTRASADRPALPVDLHLDAGHPSTAEDQLVSTHAGLGVDAMVQASAQQCTDQCQTAGADVARLPFAQDLVGDRAGAAAVRLLAQPQPADRHLGGDPIAPRSELEEGEQFGLQRASAARQAARVLGVVVGIALEQP
jgi:hypothetical protein